MSTAPVEVRAPAEHSEGTRSQVLRWLKSVGEPVQAHEPLIELETDKVTVEVAAPVAGVLMEILKPETAEVAPGDLLGRIARSGTQSPPAERHAGVDAAVTAAAVVGARAGADRGADPTHLSPAVRRLLAERGLSPQQVRGTGPGGRITVDDVLGAADARPADGEAHAAAQPAICAGTHPAVQRVPHSAVRKRIAARMVASLLNTAPHVTTVFEVDMTRVLAHRARHREAFASRGASLTFTAYFVRAAVQAIAVVPHANSRWTDDALEIYQSVNFGIGTATPSGLVVPVLRAAETLDLEQTAREINELARRARAGALQPEEVRGGTFTLSNHGVSGALFAAPIILPAGQAAIVGVGKIEQRVVAVTDSGADHCQIRPRCYATLTIDHRVMDGEQANQFMQVFAARLADWPE